MQKPKKSVGMLLLLSLLCGGSFSAVHATTPTVNNVALQAETVQGTVVDENGVPVTGAAVVVVGAKVVTSTDANGFFKIANVERGAQLRISLLGYKTQTVKWDGQPLNIVLEEAENVLEEAVVTAMGIRRKETSLTYATQQIKAEDLMKVQDVNVANQLEGKISGLTITPSAGGAGGASKIVLRGQKSILGSSTPLIVVDGVPLTNNTRGQLGMGAGTSLTSDVSSEGADPLSMINPDDIESMNVLKGANAAALYGSQAANGVIMITTKKGKEGKIDINYTTNVTFESPLLTPKIQTVYGANQTAAGGLESNGWGDKIANRAADNLVIATPFPNDSPFQVGDADNPTMMYIHLRNKGRDNSKDFYRTGTTFNNSVALSGGTEKVKTYFSYANTHANGMIENNSYNRNTLAFRQSYKLWNRIDLDASINYVQTVTRNRPGGGGHLNPIYHLYTTPNNVDMAYYKENYKVDNAQWYNSTDRSYYQPINYPVLDANGNLQYDENGNIVTSSGYSWTKGRTLLSGPRQDWAYMAASYNNPYWLTNMNRSKQKTDRIYGSFTGKLNIYDGLSLQARLGFDHTRYNNETKRYATTTYYSGYQMMDYGMYWVGNERTAEIYTDYLLSYDKTFEDWSVSASAGYVGHTIKSQNMSTSVEATVIPNYYQPNNSNPSGIPTIVNRFETSSGDKGATGTSKSSNWDQAALFTAQIGWQDKVYVDGSYRQDWYRSFKQFHTKYGTPISYGYWGIGANAIVSSLLEMPDWINYLKYRASYSQVGNGVPNNNFYQYGTNNQTDAVLLSGNLDFYPEPEKLGSFETGVEMLMFNNNLQFDLTFYNTIADKQFMNTGRAGRTVLLNSAKVRNTGIEATIGYDFHFGEDLRWKPTLNISFDNNKILRSAYQEDGTESPYKQQLGGARVVYQEGGSVGDIYVTDFKRDENGVLILNRTTFAPQYDNLHPYSKKIGNMNSKWQLGLSNTITYKDFQLFFLINGRIGGKVISQTEGYLDNLGFSQRTADARLNAERNGLYTEDGREAMYIHGKPGKNGVEGDYLVAVEEYYRTIGGNASPTPYIYNATNFRLRELSLNYTFRNLLGEGKHLNLSFVGRNLFFFYNDAPVDPDISLSTTNGLGGFEYFNMPSTRSFGFSAKINF
ncbi:MAG: SusC/RagA family TonB-linked outer membrane protein [Alloprevotella sp.]|nr:SusC/RagA family TonB-linked outer membrane protein [Alloprevotella sp.]MBR1652686.1 SusC/RagA family TonB-linked outer membrane protein [Alloprevotella sp.]